MANESAGAFDLKTFGPHAGAVLRWLESVAPGLILGFGGGGADGTPHLHMRAPGEDGDKAELMLRAVVRNGVPLIDAEFSTEPYPDGAKAVPQPIAYAHSPGSPVVASTGPAVAARPKTLYHYTRADTALSSTQHILRQSLRTRVVRCWDVADIRPRIRTR